MKRKRLDRNDKWGFQYFPYYQTRMDNELFHGLVSLITLTDGEYCYWELPKAGRIAVCGKGMVWLQLVPDERKRLITAMLALQKKNVGGKLYPYSVSVVYVDVAESFEYDPDGVAAYIDKYLDVIFTPKGDLKIDDRDELDEAFKNGELTKEQYNDALTECALIIDELTADIEKSEKLCCDILDIMCAGIAEGLKPIENRISKNRNIART